MSKQAFKQALFEVVENIIQYELSPSAKTLIIKYFNESNADTSYEKALQAIQTYAPDSMPQPGSESPRLAKLLRKMELTANAWDTE